MARIAGIDIPRDKRVLIALTYVFGVGLTTSKKALEATGVDPNTRVKNLTDDEVTRIRTWLNGDGDDEKAILVEGDLRRQVSQNISRKKEIGCHAGIRHRKGLPVRGQRTQTNARTRKGPKRTVAGKKKAAV